MASRQDMDNYGHWESDSYYDRHYNNRSDDDKPVETNSKCNTPNFRRVKKKSWFHSKTPPILTLGVGLPILIGTLIFSAISFIPNGNYQSPKKERGSTLTVTVTKEESELEKGIKDLKESPTINFFLDGTKKYLNAIGEHNFGRKYFETYKEKEMRLETEAKATEEGKIRLEEEKRYEKHLQDRKEWIKNQGLEGIPGVY